MKAFLKLKCSIFFAAFFLALSIAAFVLMNGSVAWFADNDEVDASNMSVSVKTDSDAGLVVDYYEISSIALSEGKNIYTFSKTPITNVTDRHLKEYSHVVAERQMLIKITLPDTMSGATVRAVTDTTDYVIEDQNDPEVNKADNPLSSVIAFYALSGVDETDGGYVVSINNSENDTVAHFVTITEDEGKRQASFDNSDILIYETPEGNTDKTIFIMLDYYEASIGYVLSVVNHLMMIGGKTDIQAGDNVEFVCDFDIVVSPS